MDMDGWVGNWHMKGKMEELIGTDRWLEDWVEGWDKGCIDERKTVE